MSRSKKVDAKSASKKPADAKPAEPDQDDDDDDGEAEDNDAGDEAVAAPKKPAVPRRTEEPDLWDRAAAWLAAHGAIPALILLTGLCAYIYSGLFAGELAGDDLTFHLAESARISDCIRAGDFDWWNPSGNAGYASAYYYQVLPQLVSAIPTAIFGHLLFWFQLSNWLPLVLAPAAAYRGMRLLGATPWQAFAAAVAMAMMNGESRWGAGASGSFLVGLYTQTWALSAFPLAFGYGARWVMRGDKLAPAIAWGAFVGLCHPFAVVGLGLALVAGAVARALPSRTKIGWPSWVGALVVMAGIATILIPKTSAMASAPYALVPLGCAAGLAIAFFIRIPGSRWTMRAWDDIWPELARVAVLGALMVLAWMPVWLPLLVDYSGFGGFPHRVADEIGPGFTLLLDWHVHGKLLDWTTIGTRLPVLTVLLPLVVAFARAPFLRWLWAPALLFALFLGLGPHMSTTQDDLLPMVRFLGAMQTLLALGIGAGVLVGGAYLWKVAEKSSAAYVIRTLLAAVASGLLVLVVFPGAKALTGRIHTMEEWPTQHHDELLQVAEKLTTLPPGRKQVTGGTENHWWNLLTYVYGRTPSLLQMGGGGLQASPVYDYLWTGRDFAKNAWIYDAPYVTFETAHADKAPAGDTVLVTTAHVMRPVRSETFLMPKFTVHDEVGHYELRRLPAPGLVSPVQVTDVMRPGTRKGQPGHDDALAWLKTDLPLADHVLAYDGYGGTTDPPDGSTIRSWQQLSPGDDADIVAQVQANKPTTFVIRESWHPRWHGYIDGVEVPVRRVTPDFPALDVPVGAHELTLRFERPWWALADWLAWPGVSLAAWLILRRWRKRHPAPVP